MGLAISSLGALIGPPITGALISQYGYLSASMFSGGVVLMGGVFYLAARLLLNRSLFAKE